jgi:hypothetical protein
MFRRQSCVIFRELTVPDQISYANFMHAKTRDSESSPEGIPVKSSYFTCTPSITRHSYWTSPFNIPIHFLSFWPSNLLKDLYSHPSYCSPKVTLMDPYREIWWRTVLNRPQLRAAIAVPWRFDCSSISVEQAVRPLDHCRIKSQTSETSVTNCQTTQCNILEDRRPLPAAEV